MSQVENAAGHSSEGSPENNFSSSSVSRADTLPDISEDHAGCLSKLDVSDGDFRTEAKVNGEYC
jgi:hypothetical protein